MKALKTQIRNWIWNYWMFRGMSKLKRSDLLANKIYLAIHETIHHTIRPEEQERIDLIEQIRSEFTHNLTPISVTDFGAGSPDAMRTKEEMEHGVTSPATYAEVSLGSKPPVWACLLFKLIRQFKPEKGIELGTCIGISASYEASAQQLNGKGVFITLEGSESVANVARENFKRLNLNNLSLVTGRFSQTLPLVLQKEHPIDYVFIDGHHDEQATWEYYQLILPHLAPNALVVFDDISWSDGMKKVWKRIQSDAHITLAVDLKIVGICIVA